MYAYGKNLVALKMSLHNVGAIVQDAQSSCKRQDAAFAATRPVYKQYMLIFQSDLVLPISVQILHISHSLPSTTPPISTNHNLMEIVVYVYRHILCNSICLHKLFYRGISYLFNIKELFHQCFTSYRSDSFNTIKY